MGQHPPAPAAAAGALSDLALLPRRVYRLRILGFGLAMPPIAAVLVEHQAGGLAWAWLCFTGLLWPQLAMLLARTARDPFRAELRNLLVDSALAGAWVPLLRFDLLPSTLLVTLATVDKIHTGIRGLWLWSLPGMVAAGLGMGFVTGFAADVETSLAVMLACLPMLLIHTIAVSLTSYRLVRKVQRQNRRLDELSRVDVLTGLSGRRHFEQAATALLAARHAGGAPVALLMVDVDRFKAINDGHGHAAGDDVLRMIAAVLRRALRPGDEAGRLGGDEFALVLRGSAAEAGATAERIRDEVAALHLPHLPGVRTSVSLGLAPARDADLGLREWLESADRAFYRAKSAGRNRVTAHDGDLAAAPG